MILAIKTKARTVVGRGEEGPPCDPGSELLLGGSARVSREDAKWDEAKKRSKRDTETLLPRGSNETENEKKKHLRPAWKRTIEGHASPRHGNSATKATPGSEYSRREQGSSIRQFQTGRLFSLLIASKHKKRKKNKNKTNKRLKEKLTSSQGAGTPPIIL